MVRILLVVLSLSFARSTALAQGASSEDGAEARSLFEQGVQRASDERWGEAAALFERSRGLEERPATVLNLVLAYEKLQQPVAVLRAARRFLLIAEPQRYPSERAAVQRLEARAQTQVAILDLHLTPKHATVLIDGEKTEPLADEPLTLAVEPGFHQITVRASEHEPIERELDARAGRTTVLDLALRPVSVPPVLAAPVPAPASVVAQPTSAPSRSRQRAARTLGLLGGAVTLGGLAAELVAWQRGRDLASIPPRESGFVERADAYTRARRAVIPIAALGGSLLLAGVLTTPRETLVRTPRAGTWLLFSAAVLMAGSALALSVASAPYLGGSDLHPPRREAVIILSAASVSLFAWPLRTWLRR